ncbi:MAG: ROK family transcriptional regulator [Anaerolineae bacterium]|nr:ROK family transcriptional regulator [Anaerolineae bacterium]MBT3713266.1 ROK family transcriptional regulator [Anaerolineae bacterium]MBT4311276.1 ROK family transcriptional regulator [Anaerolineae bacterium]MBT4457109.1 ROK family transcriptional regulator [Anaerolineae bacterium]MBT4841806.1 ROK family transcriptional regulator [Anaerolineae bacterium]
MIPQKATRQQTKEHNRDLVLKTIFDNETISRAEIARLTRLTRTTVSNIVSSLLEQGLVEEIGLGESLGGKAPVLLSLIADARYLIGIDLEQDEFIGAVINLRGEIKEYIEIPTNQSDGQEAINLIYQILNQLLATNFNPIIGIGVGAPGLMNLKEGIVVQAVNFDWENLPLANILNARYNLPVSVLNDSQASAIGEFFYGMGHKPNENLIVVNVKEGTSAGILINGKLFQGDGGGAGEIGHVVVQQNGIFCRCGKRGCLETLTGTKAILRRAKILAPEAKNSILPKESEKISLDLIRDAFLAKDALAQEIVFEASHYLGSSIANLVGILNIQKIVLTGEMTRFGDAWLQSVRDSMHKSSFNKLSQNTTVELGKTELQGCILGASASMLINDYSLLFKEN